MIYRNRISMTTKLSATVVLLLWSLLACSAQNTSSLSMPQSALSPVDNVAKTVQYSDLGEVGRYGKWEKVEIELAGPESEGMGEPNPFRIEVEVTFTGPQGQTYVVPGFYDGDGTGGLDGKVWKVRFSADEVGQWQFVSSSPNELLNGYRGTFEVTERSNCSAYTAGGLPDISCVGRLEYVGERYLKFAEGPYWLKGGADEPENFLAPGETAGMGSKEAAIDYLASQKINSIYMLLHNIDGDGQDVWPWVGGTEGEAKGNSDRFDVGKLREWEEIFSYIQQKGLVLHLVFEDDSGWNGFEREMYYREMVARFGHHNGLYWNIAEEYDELYYASEIKSFAEMIRGIDGYAHPITVHHAGSIEGNWQEPFLGDANLDLSSLQTANPSEPGSVNAAGVQFLEAARDAGRVIPASFDETGQFGVEQRELARQIVWAVYLSGGNYEIFTTLGSGSYLDYDGFFEDISRARTFVEAQPFWQMESQNDLLTGGEGFLFAKPGRAYIAYLPNGGTVQVDLVKNDYTVKWFNPRTGTYLAGTETSEGGIQTFAAPTTDEDWVLLVETVSVSVYLPIMRFKGS